MLYKGHAHRYMNPHLVTVLHCIKYSINLFDNSRKSFSTGMTPRDPYILLNEELVLNCTVNASFHHDSASLYFTHKPNMSVPERELSKEYITTVNNTTISLRKIVRSLEEAGTYSCKIRDVRPGVVDRQVVEVECK